MSEHDENYISPEVRRLLARVQDEVRRAEFREAQFNPRNAARRLPRPDEDAE